MQKTLLVASLVFLMAGCTKEEIRATVTTGAVIYSVGYELNRQDYCALTEEERAVYLERQGLSETHYSCEEVQ